MFKLCLSKNLKEGREGAMEYLGVEGWHGRGKESSQCKGPEVDATSVCPEKSRVAGVAGRSEVGEEESRRRRGRGGARQRERGPVGPGKDMGLL